MNYSDEYIKNLLWMLSSSTLNGTEMLSAAIQLKNYITHEWNRENSLISEQFKNAVVGKVFEIFSAFKNMKVAAQLLECIYIMAKGKLNYEWKAMLLVINNFLTESCTTFNNMGGDFSLDFTIGERLDMYLELLAHLTEHYKNAVRSDELWSEINTVLEIFCNVNSSTYDYLITWLINSLDWHCQGLKFNNVKQVMKILNYLLEMFENLNSQDIPDFFFDRFETYMALFKRLFEIMSNNVSNFKSDIKLQEQADKINIRLVSSIQMLYKYHDEVGDHIATFTMVVTNMLVNNSNVKDQDEMIFVCFNFLRAAMNYPQNKDFFSQNLDSFLNNIIMPYMMTPNHGEFLDCSEAFVEQFLSDDLGRSLKSATEFSRDLAIAYENAYTDKITTIMGDFFSNSNHDSVQMDCMVNLIISGFCLYSSQQFGSRDIKMSIDQLDFIKNFFMNQLGTLNLQKNEQCNIKAIFIFKYFIEVRSYLTEQDIVTLFGYLFKCMNSQCHSLYAFSFQVSFYFVTMKRNTRLDSGTPMNSDNDHIKKIRLDLCEAFISSLNYVKGTMVSNRMALVVRICLFQLYESRRDSFSTWYEALGRNLVDILYDMNQNTKTKYEYYYNIFESVGFYIKYYSKCSAKFNLNGQYLNTILEMVETMVQQNVEEFYGYCLQIKSLKTNLLISNGPISESDYQMFTSLLNASYYTRDKRHYINGYVNLLSAFISASPEQNSVKAHPNFNAHLDSMLGLFQFLMENKMYSAGLTLVNTIVISCNSSLWTPHLVNIFSVIFSTLGKFKNQEDQGLYIYGRKQFDEGCINLFINIINSTSIGDVYSLMNGMGQGLFEKFIETEIINRQPYTLQHDIKLHILNCFISNLMNFTPDLNTCNLYATLSNSCLLIFCGSLRDVKLKKNEDNTEFEEDKFKGDSVYNELKTCKFTSKFVKITTPLEFGKLRQVLIEYYRNMMLNSPAVQENYVNSMSDLLRKKYNNFVSELKNNNINNNNNNNINLNNMNTNVNNFYNN